MCGRYALALRPGQIRQRLEDDNMPVYEGIDDDDGDSHDGDSGGGSAPRGAPRQSYNFAPGYHGVVYRADVPDWGAGPRRGGRGGAGADEDHHGDGGGDGGEQQHGDSAPHEKNSTNTKDTTSTTKGDGDSEVHYKLQSMKWGLIPFWTKRNPDYGSMLKTINCRDDSLSQAGGMWASMKARKRCVVVAQGFYEWLKKDGVKDKMPHYIRRRDGKLLCMAGLWDVVQYEDDDYKHYTYTIITTDSNKQLSFLHDRMPVVLENGSDEVRTWLDPARHEWSAELQSLLRPWSGELEIYPVSKDVGKVGNNSPTFIIPLDSKENKNNIANFFTSKASGGGGGGGGKVGKANVVKKEEEGKDVVVGSSRPVKTEQPEIEITQDKGFVAEGEEGSTQQRVKEEDNSQPSATTSPRKRPAPRDDDIDDKNSDSERAKGHSADYGAEPPLKKEKLIQQPPAAPTTTRTTRSANAAQKKTMTTTATSPGKHLTTGAAGQGKNTGGAVSSRPKISATSNGTKSPAKGKNPGTQKITKFFGNSA
ncbi:hypothetical protein Micbo1qcDRAFT_235558 [Microdochium bolleyi]|uniref:DUF159 domain protein n=1 Tax=Microdochium bolleyi TaxID=196109 RepID=A0A136IWH1_9PEZI|nr:hypothetical protein Micbo1qcDRAFT_235558 [Microdochium bolleyi]